MKDPSFLSCGEWIMETGHFSFLTSLLGRLFHFIMIIWPGGFNSRPGGFNSRPRPVYFGMCRISLWPELRYWVCSSNPFIRRTFGRIFRACALSFYTYCFRPHQGDTLGHFLLFEWGSICDK